MTTPASPLRPRDDLPFCQLDGGLIFLDVQNDAYFRLSARLERAFLAYLGGVPCDEADVARLVQRRILVDASASADHTPTPVTVARSAMEQVADPSELPLLDVLETFWITVSTRLQLRLRRLDHILGSLDAYRRSKAPLARQTPGRPIEPSLRNAAHAFLRARRYVPIETRCLLDSLSMTRYLARRGHHVCIVFGVTEDPFAAHCWIQTGDLLLNDAIGNVETYTPIWTF
ncbi:lasso peptide biosynthesis B2 protein [Luteimonas sp. XNQY3]|nr:lasso peptide biosynthesis B2 protein [Luteimonas sp. XNQY3]MCD9007026.1 lasso peptide biosynthesis B2 protein [Luteimonas sp. XNQY3]